MSGLALVTDDIAEMLKMQHILMDSLGGWGGGLPPRNLHF